MNFNHHKIKFYLAIPAARDTVFGPGVYLTAFAPDTKLKDTIMNDCWGRPKGFELKMTHFIAFEFKSEATKLAKCMGREKCFVY